MRLRSPTTSPVGLMEKGPTKNQHSQLCLLASLSAFFWLSLLYFHFVILGAGTVDDSARILNSNISTASIDLVKSPHLNAPSNSTTHKPKIVHLAPPIWPSSTSSLPDSQQSVNDSSSNAQVHPAITDRQKTNSTLFVSDSKPEAHNVSSSEAQVKPGIVDDHKGDNTQHKEVNFPFMKALRTVDNKSDPCGGRYIYVHDLPPKFNEDMLKECKSLSKWTNMCKFTTNAGLGPPLENVDGVFSETGWYATNQFAVDVIFNNRMKQYECLTKDSSLAAAIFVPFYAGFDIARYLWGFNTSVRDAASLELVDWLMKKPEWNIMGGHDHFLVAGRITWDFRRLSDDDADWGSKLLFLPAAKNMSMLVVESSPWNANDFGIPYPTYFHPAKDSDVFSWQERMMNLERKWLFSFAGAPRPGNPSSIMKMFQSSLFCLQPQGDSYTRRSAFDSILAGCIPEDDIRKRNMSIEQRLSEISPEQVRAMREEVINLIPNLIYADPRSKLETLKDAFDVAAEINQQPTSHVWS